MIAKASKQTALSVPRSLLPRVLFWKQLWGKQANRVYSLVDMRHPWVIHTTIDCRDLFPADTKSDARERKCDQRIWTAKKKVKQRLRKHKRRPGRALLRRFGNRRRMAATAYRNLILLEGRYDSLQRALTRGKRFVGQVEGIFHSLGLRPELARVTIIESLANPEAVSRSGAVGAYQFVSGTARQYLMVDEAVDERLDPVRSGWAAGLYLKELHRRFGNWPLAMTAYNTGPTRLKRLIRKRRTRDLGKIANRGNSGGFGFDGQNYYAQLAAVIQLTAASSFAQKKQRPSVVRSTRSMHLAELASCLNLEPAALAAANPALSKNVIQAQTPVPAGYLVSLPGKTPNKRASL